MSDEFESFRCRSGFSSPPCYAAEVAPDYFDPLAVDPEQARDVARWRKAERVRLRTRRMEMPVAERQAVSAALAVTAGRWITRRVPLHLVQRIAGVVFVVFGVITLVSALT